MSRRLRGVYGKPLARKLETTVTNDLIIKMGDIFVKHLKAESKKEFAKRGWSGRDPKGGPKIWDSFSVKTHPSSIIVESTFYGMRELTTTGIPERKMTWLTQEGQHKNLTDTSFIGLGKAGVRKAPSRKHGKAKLIVPIKDDKGYVVFRTAPLKIKDAWIHPGIAKFTFVQRALKKAHEECQKVYSQTAKQVVVDQIKRGLGA